MLTFVSQDIVIEKLNRYFTSQNLPLKCNEDGICNGLAYVYAQYVLMGDEDKFRRILKAIASGNVDQSLQPGEFELFITHVLLSFIPEQYNKKLSQAQAIQAFGQSETVLEVGMVLDDNQWQSVIKDIDLKDDEVMLVNSINHTVAVSRKKGKYIVYDPNYLLGDHPIRSERALIQELHQNVFAYKGKNLGLRVNIVKKKSNEVSLIKRNALFLYQKYVSIENVNDIGFIDDKTTRSLLLAIECSDEESVLYLLSLGAKMDDRAMAKSIFGNHANVVRQLIQDKSTGESTVNNNIITAIEDGRLEAFDALMTHSRYKKQFDTVFLNTNKPMLIKMAAKGGNLLLFQFIIEKCKENKEPYHDIKSAMKKHDHCYQALIASIDGGSVDCIKCLIQTLNDHQIEISDDDKMKAFLHALKSNQLYVCLTLLKELPPEDLSHIEMSLGRVEKTNVYILKELQNHGVVFSEKAEAIMAKKEQRAIGLLLLIGIELEKFFEYITKKQGITVNRNQLFQPADQQSPEDMDVVPRSVGSN